MKVILCVSLIYLSTVCCYHADSENQRRDENLITTSENSREDHHNYDSYEHEARRNGEHRKTTEGYKRIPAVRRIVPGEEEHYDTEHGSHNSGKTLHHEDDVDSDRNNFTDRESDHVDYHSEDLSPLSIKPPSPPPVVFFETQPLVSRRQNYVPVYRRPSYRFVDAGPPPVSYRAINPVAYPVPRVRNVVLGYPPLPAPPVRYAYATPSFGGGVVPVEYRGYIADEYDDFRKKK